MSRPLVDLIAGARPNFMKIAPVARALQADGRLDFRLIHTGQHHDREMNEVFFEELGIPEPELRLGCGGGTHAEQTARIMTAYELICREKPPAATLVVGDVNSTLACTIVAKKLGIPVAHVEAGLRSGDMAMPEEINRLLTDAISDWFFVTEPSGAAHLAREGKPASRVHSVGNVMIDNLFYQLKQLEGADASGFETAALKRALGRYGVVTLHRPSNVDDEATLQRIAGALREISAHVPLVFPVHPRTRKNLERFRIDLGERVSLMGPQSYMSFLHLWKDAAVVLTDSGGLQEETTALGVPCVTLRENTERPVTVEQGTNVLAGTQPAAIVAAARAALGASRREARRPEHWDGQAAVRIVEVMAAELGARREKAVSSRTRTMPIPQVEIMGCKVHNLTMGESLDVIEGFIAEGTAHQHVVVNVDKLVKANSDPGLRAIVNNCALVNVDGMPVVWASRLLGQPLKERVAGVDLFEAILERAGRAGWRVYFLGARAPVVERVVSLARARHPGLQVAGHRDGYWAPSEEAGVVEEIRSTRPDILFVAISSPRKEEFLGRWQEHMRIPFAMGVGGSFDVMAGLVKRAPAWMQKSGLEWFYRFLQEPRRMFRRYFIDDMAFFGLLARELGHRRVRELRRVGWMSVGATAAALVAALET